MKRSRLEVGEWPYGKAGFMRAILTYQGPLRVRSHVDNLHELRQAFHPQLRRLWGEEDVLTVRYRRWTSEDAQDYIPTIGRYPESAIPRAQEFRVGQFTFLPLVADELNLVCYLDIVILRRDGPGLLVSKSGDIDNRVKTLLDSLRVPAPNQINSLSPTQDQKPFFCLLQDDSLITGMRITTERWLEPLCEGDAENDVNVKITATIRPTKVTFQNLAFLSGALEG